MALVSLAATTSAVAMRLGLLAPILLVAVGVVVSYLPDAPEVTLDPELVFYGLLPPLLYIAANQMSVPGFRANLRPILLLAVGLVVVTVVAVGLVLHAMVPDIPLAACFALGAVVAPPDPVAATAVAKRVGLPRRIVTILEGEGMLNDATALVILRVAVAAVAGTAASATEITADATVAVVGGLAAGIGVALGAAWLHRHLHDPLLHNTLSLLTPFVAYALAEWIEASGVVACVVCGLYLGHRWTVLVSAASRIQMRAFWKMAGFLLESTVFLLVGLQMRDIWNSVSVPTSEVMEATAAVVGTVIVVRFAWVYPATYLARLVPRIRERDPAPPLSVPTVVAWAGMRGVITLAAAFTLPGITHRDLLIWLAFAVIVATLVLQGLTLAPLARWLRIPGDDPKADALAYAAVQHDAIQAALARLDEEAGGAPPEVVEQLRQAAERRSHAAWERLGPTEIETDAQAYRRLRHAMVGAERDVFRQARNEGRIPENLMQRAEHRLDLEESMLGAPAVR